MPAAPAVAAIAGSHGAGSLAEKRMCLVTGATDFPVRLHSAIKGVKGKGAQTAGANIVSFNLDAFRSFGKNQGFNAPVGEKAEFAYTTALNRMLARDSRQKIQVGDATTVFWAQKKHELENAFVDIFGTEPAKGEPEQDYKSLISMFRSPESGANERHFGQGKGIQTVTFNRSSQVSPQCSHFLCPGFHQPAIRMAGSQINSHHQPG